VLAAVMVAVAVPFPTALEPIGADVTRQEIRLSAVRPITFWCLSWPFVFALGFVRVRDRWGCVFVGPVSRPANASAARETCRTPDGRAAGREFEFLRGMIRGTWLFGSLLLVEHVVTAFHLGHGWSHAAAWEHTRRVGGYGDGVFVNYAFVLVWLADALWLCAAPRAYLARRRGLHWAVHGFLAFVVFNAAVVFADRPMRVVFAVASVTAPLLAVVGFRLVRRVSAGADRA
jgi:hypothetical protein